MITQEPTCNSSNSTARQAVMESEGSRPCLGARLEFQGLI